MTEEAKRRLAYAIARASGSTGNSIYSYDAGLYYHMSGISGSYFDYTSGSHFTDQYDYKSGGHWNYRLQQGQFTGYDYSSGHHFTGSVKSGLVSFYDYGCGRWSSFKV